MASITLIISGSIAAVKAPELIRQLRAKNIGVHVIITRGGSEFVSVKEIEKISGNKVSTDIFAADEKKDMWHIRFSRETDMVVVAPATADIIAKMAHGIADDMATATLLANNKKLLVAPAMNTQMWIHPATTRNVKQIKADGAIIIEPGVGMLACGETGPGRMAEPEAIVAEILKLLPPLRGEAGRGGDLRNYRSHSAPHPTLSLKGGGLTGFHAIVTSGPTHEPIDPVRYIANRSSGKQGHAIARALAAAGAKVTLVSGPTALADPAGAETVHVKTAKEMFAAVNKALPADIVVCAAAVGDWGVAPARQKIKKRAGSVPHIDFIENPDILAHVAAYKKRPALVIGFAAETEKLAGNAARKHAKKGADWVLANDVSGGKVFGEDDNEIVFISGAKKERWKKMSKDAVAETLVEKIISSFK